MSWLSRLERARWAGPVAVAVLLRLALIAAYPALFGGDSVVRLANADRVLLSYQLPTLQALIHLLYESGAGLVGVRLLMVLLGGLATAGFYFLCAALSSERAAFYAALLFATHPFVTAYSIVPYQEILMLGGLAFAFAWHFEGRDGAASTVLGLACLTRYEAWLAAPVLAAAYGLRGGGFSGWMRGALLYGWAPAAWILAHAGVTPAGSFAVESAWNPERLWRWVYLGWITLKTTPWPALALTGFGLWRVFSRRPPHPLRLYVLGMFGLLFLAAILASAHGERDQPDRFVTAREAHIPIAAALALSAVGLAPLLERRGAAPLALATVALGAWGSAAYVAREVSEPKVALSREAARMVEATLQPTETIVVLARPVPGEMLERFLTLAERTGDRRAALETLASLDVAPPDAQRVQVQAGARAEQVVSWATLPVEPPPRMPSPAASPDWVLVWSDFEPTNDAERRLAESLEGVQAERVWARGPISLTLVRALR